MLMIVCFKVCCSRLKVQYLDPAAGPASLGFYALDYLNAVVVRFQSGHRLKCSD